MAYTQGELSIICTVCDSTRQLQADIFFQCLVVTLIKIKKEITITEILYEIQIDSFGLDLNSGNIFRA